MKINEIDIEIYVSNEENELLESMDDSVRSYDSFSERQQLLLDNLIRKGVVKRGMKNSQFLVKKDAEVTVRT